MRPTLYLSVLLKLPLIWSVVSLQAQPIPRTEADSLLRVLADTRSDTNRVKLLLRLGEYQIYKPGEFSTDMDSARTYARQSRGLSSKLGYYAGEATSLHLLGTISREAKAYDQSIAYHQAAIRLHQRHHNPRDEAAGYLLLAWAWRDKGNTEQARQEVLRAIDLCKQNQDQEQIAHAYLELGKTYADYGEELKNKIQYYQQGLAIYERLGNKRQQADIHRDLGEFYGNNTQALIELRKALSLYRSVNYPNLQGVYDLIGNVSTMMGSHEDGVKYGLLAVRTAEALKDTSLQLCTIYNRIGLTYFQLQEFDKVHFYWGKSLLIAQKYNDRSSIYTLTLNIVSLLQRQQQPQKALTLLQNIVRKHPPKTNDERMAIAARLLTTYTELKEFAVAQMYCDTVLALYNVSEKEVPFQKRVYWSVIPFFIASKQYGQAERYLNLSEKLSRETHSLTGRSYSALLSFRLDSMRGNYHTAIKHYQLYKQLEDSIINQAKNRQIANLNVLFETEQKGKDLLLKEQSIKALIKDKQLQAKQIEQDQLIRNTIVCGVLLLLLLLGVIYNRYRLKQRSNQLLQDQQQQIHQKNQALQRLLTEQERLLKEIHHRVKNNLQIVMSLLNSQAASLLDPTALSAIQQSQHRVQAMALIHQKLYQAEGVARIPMAEYMAELVAYLHESFDLPQPIGFDLQVEPIELDVTQAVPLGLIINEAVTNALKYAFPSGRSGRVRVGLGSVGGAGYELVIADDGVGLPADFDPAQSRSLGMSLIRGFSEQLGGQLQISGQSGLAIRLQFHEEAPTDNP